jgi:glycosyltransferase involved in cell wall biosynthesis
MITNSNSQSDSKNSTSEPFVTFIIPSLGRPALKKALQSIIDQKEDRWRAIVSFDHLPPSNIPDDPRISAYRFDGGAYSNEGYRSRPGAVRNYVVPYVTTEWIAFLDDDDIVSSDYVQRLIEDSSNVDVVVFRMMYPDMVRFLPKPGIKVEKMGIGCLGISYAVRKSVFDKHSFRPGRGADWGLIRDLRKSGMKFKFSNYVTYMIRFRCMDDRAIRRKTEIEAMLKECQLPLH